MTTSRRRSRFVTIVAGFMALGAAPPVGPAHAAASGRPNVLVILTDDQRADSMPFMAKASRWLREQGREFPAAYATIPICAPMRSSIMSGRYQHNHGVENNLTAPQNLDQSATLQK